MKRASFITVISILFIGTVDAQVAVVAPSLETQVALNHVEQIQQAVQTYETMLGVKQGIDQGLDVIEKVNSKLTTVRDVQNIATRSAACIRHIERIYEKIAALEVDSRYVVDLMTQCNQATRECVNITAYGAKIFSDNFLKMSDAERLNETRQVLSDIDRLLAQVNYINTQANAIKFNNQMLNANFR